MGRKAITDFAFVDVRVEMVRWGKGGGGGSGGRSLLILRGVVLWVRWLVVEGWIWDGGGDITARTWWKRRRRWRREIKRKGTLAKVGIVTGTGGVHQRRLAF